ncbi:MAG: 5-formyltetrahydrofolate cyclo-ligase [Cyanobium sp.]
MPAQPGSPLLEKASLRRHYRSQRRQVLVAVSEGLRRVACSALPQRVAPGQWLGLYWPIAGEPDLAPWAPGGLAERLAACGDGPRLALPAVLPPRGAEPHGSLIYRPWRRGAALRPDACGIPAPLPDQGLAPQDLALLLVPALALDRRGVRLGSGGGWYDRLRSDPRWRSVPALAVLPSACRCEALPADPWDVPFDGWLDEQGLGWCFPA